MSFQKDNINTKNIREFTSADTIYIRDLAGFNKPLYLCQFLGFNEKTGSVTGTIINDGCNEMNNGSRLEREVGRELKAGLSKCSLYGKANEDSQSTNHWFDHLGYALNPYEAEKEETNNAHIESHESYAVIRGSRRNSNGTELFGTSVSHNQTISITICTATHKRDLANDWIHSGKELIEVELSENQFAQFVTSMNAGSGIPCTIRHISGKRAAPTPFISKQELFQQEFQKQMNNLTIDLRKTIEQTTDILTNKSTITKADRLMILGDVEKLVSKVSVNIPFVRDQFREQLDDMITEAKVEIEAFAENMIRRKGLEALGATNEEFRNILTQSEKKDNHE